MPLPAQPLPHDRSSAGDYVYNRLREWVLSGPLEPGEVVKDGEIARLLGVSRTPVREALLRLESVGLVESLSGRWTRVAPLQLDQAANLYRTVGVLDGLAAEQSAARLSPGDLGAMATANRTLRESHDPEERHHADEQFHAIYRNAAENAVVHSLLENALFEIRRLERVYFKDPYDSELSYRGHQRILAALKKRDAASAFAAARSTWLETIPSVEKWLRAPREESRMDESLGPA